jgi:general secretion pathway protein G
MSRICLNRHWPRTRKNSTRQVSRPARRAFTLLEVIVVITIIAILAALVAPRMLGWVGKAKSKAAAAEASAIAEALELYLLDNGMNKVPDGFDINQLMEGPDPYFKKADDLIDPWDNPYVVRVPGEVNIDFDIISYGADGTPGGEGEDADITN